MPPNDNIATTLIIQMMPLMTREFRIRMETHLMLTDRDYAMSVLDLAFTTSNERLRAFAMQLRDRLGILAERAANSTSVASSHGGDSPDATEPSKAAARDPKAPVSSSQPRYVKSLR